MCKASYETLCIRDYVQQLVKPANEFDLEAFLEVRSYYVICLDVLMYHRPFCWSGLLHCSFLIQPVLKRWNLFHLSLYVWNILSVDGYRCSTFSLMYIVHLLQGQIIDFRGMIQDAIKGASSEIALHSFNCNPDPSVSYYLSGPLW